MITLAAIEPLGLKTLLQAQWKAEAETFPGGHEARKAEFDKRLRIDAERHLPLIHTRICELYNDADTAADVCKHADTRHNSLKRIADRVATPYETPPFREIREVADDQQRAFLDAYRDANTDTIAATWSRYAFLCNVVHVLPRWEGEPGELCWVTVLPHKADVVWDPRGERDPSILVYECSDLGAHWVAVDRERWWWLSKNWEIVCEEPHPIGLTPWAEFRVAPRQPGDYWCRGAGHALVDGTLQIGAIAAGMEWVRRTSARKLITISAGENDEKPPPGQTIGSELPFVMPAQGTLNVHDTVVTVDDFVKHIEAVDEDLAEAYGLPVSEIDASRLVQESAAAKSFERLVKLRNSMLTHLRPAERQLAVRTGALLSASGRLSGVTTDQIKRGFRVSWPPLTFADTPKSQVETAQAEIGLAQTNIVAAYQAKNPGLTFEEAKAEVDRNIKIRGEYNDILAARNLPGDPRRDGESLPQAQGRVGGQTAAANRSSDDEQDEEAEYDA
jgi:hypothetical protein